MLSARHIIDRIKDFVLDKSIIVRFILLNIVVFVGIHLLSLFTGADFTPSAWLALPPDASLLLFKPWGLVTYMFTHYDFFHLLFNMLWLYWFGIVFMDYFSSRSFWVTYILGGLAGALFYYAGCYAFDFASAGLLGSSAAVFAVVIATAMRAPNYHLGLWLIGAVKIKWIAIIYIAFMLLTAGKGNYGGLLAHFGGIFAGVMVALNAKYKWLKKKKKCVILHLPDQQCQIEIEREMDDLLKKVRQSGYNSLSKTDKERLVYLSKRLK